MLKAVMIVLRQNKLNLKRYFCGFMMWTDSMSFTPKRQNLMILWKYSIHEFDYNIKRRQNTKANIIK